MTVAAIDIGTNTVLLLVARVADDGSITPLLAEQRVPRLGKAVDATRRISSDGIERAARVLTEYCSLMKEFRPDATVVCATSAVRDAANREEVLERLGSAATVPVEVLTGEEEAVWTYHGALSGFPETRRATVVDIGGGSTEVTIGDRQGIAARMSIDIGSVRLTERILRDDPPTREQIAECLTAIDDALRPLAALDAARTTLIGVAGTATTLAVLDQGLREFSLAAVSGHRLSLPAVSSLADRLAAMPVREIRSLSDVLEGRADIITAGALILRRTMECLGCREMLVSERGVRYGLVVRAWERARGLRRG